VSRSVAGLEWSLLVAAEHLVVRYYDRKQKGGLSKTALRRSATVQNIRSICGRPTGRTSRIESSLTRL